MTRMKEPEEEHRRLKKMYAEVRLQTETVQDALQKSGDAVSAQGDGAAGSCHPKNKHQVGMHSL